MLAADEARARLESFRNRDWIDAADRRARTLPRKLRPLAEALVVDLRASSTRLDRAQRARRFGAELDELPDRHREVVFAALHPQMGRELSQLWVDLRARPYSVGSTRRAFRSPANHARTAARRFEQLQTLLGYVGPYPYDVIWFAAWTPHVVRNGSRLPGHLLATAIDLGGDMGEQVFDTLVSTANGGHQIAVFGNHVTHGLLGAARPDGWDHVRRLLIAAQRQEGLRQAVLEAADEGHPDAFRLVLDTVIEHDLVRFAATVRAVTVWLGMPADVEAIPQIRERLTLLQAVLTDTNSCRDALESGEAWKVYVALCGVAMHDVDVAIGWCSALRADPDRDVRATVLDFLDASRLESVRPWVAESLTDPDIDVAMSAAQQVAGWHDNPVRNLLDPLWQLAGRLPATSTPGDVIGIHRHPTVRDRDVALRLMLAHLGNQPLDVMLPWLPFMSVGTRQALAYSIRDLKRLTPELRAVVFELLTDRSSIVRDAVVDVAGRLQLDDGETEAVESLLTRQSTDTRQTAIALLTNNRSGAQISASATRLWNTGNDAQRDAAAELVATLPERTRKSVAEHLAARGATPRQRELMGIAAAAPERDGDITEYGPASATSHDPGLGLLHADRRSPVPAPRAHDVAALRGPDAVLRCISALDDVAYAHRDVPVVVTEWDGSKEMLLGDVRWYPSPLQHRVRVIGESGGGTGLLLADTFHEWWEHRDDTLRGSPPLEAAQAWAALQVHSATSWKWGVERGLVDVIAPMAASPVGELRSADLVEHVMSWLFIEQADRSTVEYGLAALETTYARIPGSLMRQVERQADREGTLGAKRRDRGTDWRQALRLPWASLLTALWAYHRDLFDDSLVARWFALDRFRDEPVPGAVRYPVANGLLLDAHRRGVATDDDIRDSFLARGSRLLPEATRHRRATFVEQHPAVARLADEFRDRALEIERRRGELPTSATRSVTALSSVDGAELACELLSRLGRSSLVRGSTAGDGRDAVFSRLLRVSYPAPDDDASTLRDAANTSQLSDQRLLELAVYAPQWVALVEAALGWDGLTDAVWWIHAHTKDNGWNVSSETRDHWTNLSAERTPLSAVDLLDGAVDVEWFRSAHERLGVQRWAKLARLAKLASGGAGHRRAQLFAEALLGDIDEEILTGRISDKRNQDAVRAVGLIPLPDGADERTDCLVRRYGLISEFERGSRKFGSQRAASEALAARIAIENLARTAGYADPQRFIWAMEAAEAGPLADGPMSVIEGEVTVTLAVDDDGVAEITVDKSGKRLKNVPAAVKRAVHVKELLDRRTALRRQAVRVRRSLEDAMVRQEFIEVGELRALDRHPVLAPMLRLTVFVDHGGAISRWHGDGFADADDAACVPDGAVRLAHPTDLVATGGWIRWQERLFEDATRQPFKQVFRELYVPTATERAAGSTSARYEGHQLQPRQAAALFRQRGWMNDHDSGEAWRVFHRHGIVAHVGFLNGFLTPAEVELPTIRHVRFIERADASATPIDVDAVPAIVFSEAMRDLDLVVSVAHAGGVDPEASASTVEMRAALARETIRLTRLDNVRIERHHLLIDGRLGEYSVHLGSGVVHRRPGGAICIIPVAAQRRGRLFLPFADDDPKTAEIMSKLLLLARDDQIKDPSILAQL